jgi:hypothetical protein
MEQDNKKCIFASNSPEITAHEKHFDQTSGVLVIYLQGRKISFRKTANYF